MKDEGTGRIRVCPRCGRTYTEPPALSRTDSQTAICPDCGVHESLEALGVGAEEQEEILSIIHRAMGGRQ